MWLSAEAVFRKAAELLGDARTWLLSTLWLLLAIILQVYVRIGKSPVGWASEGVEVGFPFSFAELDAVTFSLDGQIDIFITLVDILFWYVVARLFFGNVTRLKLLLKAALIALIVYLAAVILWVAFQVVIVKYVTVRTERNCMITGGSWDARISGCSHNIYRLPAVLDFKYNGRSRSPVKLRWFPLCSWVGGEEVLVTTSSGSVLPMILMDKICVLRTGDDGGACENDLQCKGECLGSPSFHDGETLCSPFKKYSADGKRVSTCTRELWEGYWRGQPDKDCPF